MAKLKNPLMSLKAQGGLTRLFSLAKRRGRHILERKPIPTDARSSLQLFYRHMFTKCANLWHTLSEAEKQEWESLARPRHMTGYAWFVSQCLRPNPGIYLPLQGGTMTGDIDMDGNRILDLPDPLLDQEAATKAYTDALILPATQVEPSHIDPATFDDLQDLINNTMSAGRTTGGLIEASGALGDIKVNLGTGFIKTTDSPNGLTRSFNWSDTVIVKGAAPGNIIDKEANYIYIDYSAGVPAPKATTNRLSIEFNRMFTIGRVYRDGATLHIVNSGFNLANHTRYNHERLIQARGFERASGGIISEKAARYLASTAGVFYLGANKIDTVLQDTSPAGPPDILTRWYHDALGAWVSNPGIEGASAAGQISNEHYDTPTGLADIAGPRYGVFWIFIHFDSDLHVVYGTGSYKLADAENATVPPLPEAVSAFATLAAKIIVGSADPNFTSIVSAYETLFPVSTPPNHDDLGGILTDNHHARYADAEAQAVADARIAIHALISAAHHARYTNGEAVTAAKTVKLDDFATPDDNADLNASAARHGLLKKLDGVATHFLNGLGNWVLVAASALTVAETEVFSGNSPVAWTDLDLHETIGAQATLVLLKVHTTVTDAYMQIAVRKNGDTDEQFDGGDYPLGAAISRALNSYWTVLVVVTDTSGVIEWRTSAVKDYTIDVIAYIK